MLSTRSLGYVKKPDIFPPMLSPISLGDITGDRNRTSSHLGNKAKNFFLRIFFRNPINAKGELVISLQLRRPQRRATSIVNDLGSHQPNSRMVMLGVIPTEEVQAKSSGILQTSCGSRSTKRSEWSSRVV